MKYICILGFFSVLLIISIYGCAVQDDSPSDAKIKFVFHPDCPSVKVSVYIDNEYKDLIFSDGSYEYHVNPGTISYQIRRSSDNKVIWSG